MSDFTSQWHRDYVAREAARRDKGNLTTLDAHLGVTGIERESDLHDQVTDECRRRGWLWVHARMDKASHMTIGAPDFIVIADQGRVLWVECKRKDGKLSKEQQAFKAMAEKLGHKVHIVRSLQEFVTLADWPVKGVQGV
jgi:hypothetical protein